MTQKNTDKTDANVEAFINSFVDKEEKRKDSFELIELMREISGYTPKIWEPSIIGFGTYCNRYESGHEEIAPLIGFSPRKSAFSLYVYSGLEEHKYLLKDLGQFKIGTACIYAKKLSDINQNALKDLITETINFKKTKHP